MQPRRHENTKKTSLVLNFINTATYLATETRRHGEEHARHTALDAAPHSGGLGVQTANERPPSVRSFVHRLRA